jgi:hypothetical protein
VGSVPAEQLAPLPDKFQVGPRGAFVSSVDLVSMAVDVAVLHASRFFEGLSNQHF